MNDRKMSSVGYEGCFLLVSSSFVASYVFLISSLHASERNFYVKALQYANEVFQLVFQRCV